MSKRPGERQAPRRRQSKPLRVGKPAAKRHSPHARDAALRRLRSANRWLISASAALTGLFTALAATAFSGHTVKVRQASTTATPATKGTAKSSHTTRSLKASSPPRSVETEGATSEEEPSEALEAGSEGETSADPKAATEAEEAATTPEVVEEPVEEAVKEPVEEPVVSGGS